MFFLGLEIKNVNESEDYDLVYVFHIVSIDTKSTSALRVPLSGNLLHVIAPLRIHDVERPLHINKYVRFFLDENKCKNELTNETKTEGDKWNEGSCVKCKCVDGKR